LRRAVQSILRQRLGLSKADGKVLDDRQIREECRLLVDDRYAKLARRDG
jgi:hypothetical protein